MLLINEILHKRQNTNDFVHTIYLFTNPGTNKVYLNAVKIANVFVVHSYFFVLNKTKSYTCRFRMITLKLIMSQIQSEDWFVMIDLKDTYFHIEILAEPGSFSGSLSGVKLTSIEFFLSA